jgi:EpsI family protein
MSAQFPPDRTRTLSRREVLTGLAMLSAAGVAVARRPDQRLDYLGNLKLENVIPTQIGAWKFVTASGLIVPPDDQLALTVYSQLLTRVYYDGTTPIWLLIAYSADQTGFLQVHRPEFCYTAAGYTLSDFAPHRIQLSPARAITTNSLTAVRDASNEKLVYWTRIGHHVPLSWAQQKLTVAEENLRGFIPDAALVRISTQGLDEAAALRSIDQFTRAMVAAIPQPLQRVFVG